MAGDSALLVGLTGGIGSGKSTVAAALADRGVPIADADVVAREVVEPGGAAYDDLVARFGATVLDADGRVDRPALASMVFADAEARRDLNAITHPRIGQRMAELVAEAVAGGAPIVVLDVPLLSPKLAGSYGLGAVIVVDTPPDVAVARLVEQRDFTEEDARARIASQISREERRSLVGAVGQGWVIDNSRDRAALEAEVERVWAALRALTA